MYYPMRVRLCIYVCVWVYVSVWMCGWVFVYLPTYVVEASGNFLREILDVTFSEYKRKMCLLYTSDTCVGMRTQLFVDSWRQKNTYSSIIPNYEINCLR